MSDPSIIRRLPLNPAQELLRCYGSSWNIRRAGAEIWVADRTIGSSSRVIAGPPDELLQKLDCLPATAGTVVRQDVGGWISGPMLEAESSS